MTRTQTLRILVAAKTKETRATIKAQLKMVSGVCDLTIYEADDEASAQMIISSASIHCAVIGCGHPLQDECTWVTSFKKADQSLQVVVAVKIYDESVAAYALDHGASDYLMISELASIRLLNCLGHAREIRDLHTVIHEQKMTAADGRRNQQVAKAYQKAHKKMIGPMVELLTMLQTAKTRSPETTTDVSNTLEKCAQYAEDIAHILDGLQNSNHVSTAEWIAQVNAIEPEMPAGHTQRLPA